MSQNALKKHHARVCAENKEENSQTCAGSSEGGWAGLGRAGQSWAGLGRAGTAQLSAGSPGEPAQLLPPLPAPPVPGRDTGSAHQVQTSTP